MRCFDHLQTTNGSRNNEINRYTKTKNKVKGRKRKNDEIKYKNRIWIEFFVIVNSKANGAFFFCTLDFWELCWDSQESETVPPI